VGNGKSGAERMEVRNLCEHARSFEHHTPCHSFSRGLKPRFTTALDLLVPTYLPHHPLQPLISRGLNVPTSHVTGVHLPCLRTSGGTKTNGSGLQ
jgi:hypothetical protein